MTYPGLMPWTMRDLTEREWDALCANYARRPTESSEEMI